jgi:hypothetical protein
MMGDYVPTNAEVEERWIEACNQVYDIARAQAASDSDADRARARDELNCLLPDGTVTNLETCCGWLQDSAYQGFELKVERGQVYGEPGAIVSRFR